MSEQTQKAGKYLAVFAALLVLTAITVGVAKLHLGAAAAIAVALLVASVKGTLVAGYFMHLWHEQKWIYLVLALTAFFFLFMIFVPYLVTQSDYRLME